MQPRPPLLPWLALALLTLGAVAQPAAAQTPAPGLNQVNLSMQITDPGQALVPERPYALEVKVSYQYAQGGITGSGIVGRLPPGTVPDPNDDPCADITLEDAPPWAAVRVLIPQVCFHIDPGSALGSQTLQNTTFVEVNATTGAPALVEAPVKLMAHAPAKGVFAEATGEQQRMVRPAWVGRLQVTSPLNFDLQGGVPTRVAVTVQNVGNGPIQVHFRNNFSAPQGVRVTVPERFNIEAPGDMQVAYVTLQAPWTGPVKGQVLLSMDTVHPTHPDLVGDTPRLSFDVQGKAALPGPGVEAMVFVLAGVGLLAARRGR